ncbi:MAG TPA: signal peptidase I [Gammaproteobacteria bacterium]|nr:signal peptidase I [Gammaproteobacteria bacterium]
MDFALILVVVTAATGVIWAVDALFLKPGRVAAAARGSEVREPILVEYSKSFFPILLLVLVIRSFLFEPFRIPSGSMMPTLLEGDFIFVNKFAYGLRLPVINTKFLQIGEPQHGDVVVFKLPEDPSINYIKRVVGLPGETVTYDPDKHRISINGKPIAIEMNGPYPDPQYEYLVGQEQLGEHDHRILLMPKSPSKGGTYVVPAGHYFMMGDNRDNSRDSRFDGVAFVPEDNLVGRAVGIWMNWRWPSEGGPLWRRIGKGIE